MHTMTTLMMILFKRHMEEKYDIYIYIILYIIYYILYIIYYIYIYIYISIHGIYPNHLSKSFKIKEFYSFVATHHLSPFRPRDMTKEVP